MERDPIFQEEAEKLRRTREQYEEIARENEHFFSRLPWLYPNPEEIRMLNELLTATHNKIVRLRQGQDKPYFARIDFAEEGRDAEQLYMGKIGVVDKDERIVTLDWRAPVSTLYYDSNVGDVAYEAPGGKVRGRLDLKRQLEVERGQLLSVNDVDTVSNDDLLRPYLGVNADNRLKNIIATIQTEQNRIIREKLDVNMIVQGVAGSGKTTVALHRIAYLVYNHRDSIRADQYMVIGPNRFFISYISSVLPDLDVDSVPQYTYAELVQEVLREEYTVNEPSDKLALVIKGEYHGQVERHKVSMAYKEALDRFLPWYENSILPQGDFLVKDFLVLTEQEIRDAWESAQEGTGGTIKARVEQCILYLQHKLEGMKLNLDFRLSDHFKALYAQPGTDLDKAHRDRSFLEKELDHACAKTLRTFFGKTETKILSIYRVFLQNCQLFLDDSYPDAEELKQKSLANLRKRRIDPEDQPALLYLKERLQGADKMGIYRHAVIDEAQDFGEFDLFALQRTMKNCTFTVVGDIAQSIYHYRGITSWEQVRARSFERGAILCEMVKSYRTTVEIMEAANLVTEALGLSAATPVIRHGRDVAVYDATPKEMRAMVTELVRGYRDEGFQSIALLAKSMDSLKPLASHLEKAGIPVEVADSQSVVYSGGVCVMPGYLSKGLEFDAVILCDASDGVYRTDRAIDLHLLYVEMTRSLHRLDLFYDGWIAEPLASLAPAEKRE